MLLPDLANVRWPKPLGRELALSGGEISALDRQISLENCPDIFWRLGTPFCASRQRPFTLTVRLSGTNPFCLLGTPKPKKKRYELIPPAVPVSSSKYIVSLGLEDGRRLDRLLGAPLLGLLLLLVRLRVPRSARLLRIKFSRFLFRYQLFL